MAGWKVKRNDLAKVVEALPVDMDKAVQDMADDLVTVLEDRVWVDTGVIRRNVEVYDTSLMKASVGVGWYLGKGFYSGFQEDGTRHQVARPVVRPAALEAEPVFAAYVSEAVRKACRT